MRSCEESVKEADEVPLLTKSVHGQEIYCPHYKRSSCLLHFSCCEQDLFFPCHKCHNESTCELLVENESSKRQQEEEHGGKKEDLPRTEYHPQAKCSDADKMKCSDCPTEPQVISSNCKNCNKAFAPYFCAKCKIFIDDMEMDPYHCDDCGICRANKSNHKHCHKCNLCLDKQLYAEHKCMEDSGHDMCAVCMETVFSGCCFLPCSHKLHQECTRGLIQHGSLDCPICRTTFVVEMKKECGRCETITNYFKSKANSFLRYYNLIE